MRNVIAKTLLLAVGLLAIVATTSCGDDDEEARPANVEDNGNKESNDSLFASTGKTIFEEISSQQELSDFAYILERAGGNRMLSSYGTYTVFAPKNSGIRSYIEELYNDEHAQQLHHGMSENSLEGLTDSLCELIAKQHIVKVSFPIAEFDVIFGANGSITNMGGGNISFANKGNGVWILNDRATIEQSDIACGNGYLNVLDKTIFANEETVEETVYEDLWSSKADLVNVLMGSYFSCIVFESEQLELEKTRILYSRTDENRKAITPADYHVKQAFTNAYATINRTNLVLKYAEDVKQKDASMSDDELEAVLAEARCIRAFVYYNIAMLWGNVILTTKTLESDDVPMSLGQSQQSDVYQYAYQEIAEVVDKLPMSYSSEPETLARFTRNAGMFLKAEIELALGYKQKAETTLSQIEGNVDFGFADQGRVVIPIYTPNHLTLYQKEAQGNTEGLEQEWEAMTNSQYGYWAALKRLGKAQEVTGCSDYELLMPIPREEIMLNPNMKQNPGY